MIDLQLLLILSLGIITFITLDWIFKDAIRTKKINEAIDIRHQGNECIKQGRYQEAEMYLRKALEIVVPLENKHEIAMVFFYSGIMYHEQYKYVEAEGYFRKALIIFEELKDPVFISRVYGFLSLVYFHQGRWSEFEEYQKKTMELDEQHGDEERLLLNYELYEELCTPQGKWQEA